MHLKKSKDRIWEEGEEGEMEQLHYKLKNKRNNF